MNLNHTETGHVLFVGQGYGHGTRGAVSLGRSSTFTGAELVAHSWCIVGAQLEWSGSTVTSRHAYCLRHWQTGLFLQCNEDGSVQTTQDYERTGCHWNLEPVDDDDTILYDADSFCTIPISYPSVSFLRLQPCMYAYMFSET
eukprot:SAG31_NODE_4390_length_3277_cov_1.888609_4_plen_142_part_00